MLTVIGLVAMLTVAEGAPATVEDAPLYSAGAAVQETSLVFNIDNASVLERRDFAADWRGASVSSAPSPSNVEAAPLWVHLEFDAPQWRPVPEPAFDSEVVNAPPVAPQPDLPATTESPARSGSTAHASDSAPAPEPKAVPAPDTAPVPSTAPTVDGTSRLAQIEAIANTVPFNWQVGGVTFRDGCEPGRTRCPWGSWVAPTKDIWIGPGAFESRARLHYVVTHELAHAWQYANDPATRMNDLAGWGKTGVDGLEAAADCIATIWGATTTHYWDCPSDARTHMQGVLAAHL